MPMDDKLIALIKREIARLEDELLEMREVVSQHHEPSHCAICRERFIAICEWEEEIVGWKVLLK